MMGRRRKKRRKSQAQAWCLICKALRYVKRKGKKYICEICGAEHSIVVEKGKKFTQIREEI